MCGKDWGPLGYVVLSEYKDWFCYNLEDLVEKF